MQSDRKGALELACYNTRKAQRMETTSTYHLISTMLGAHFSLDESPRVLADQEDKNTSGNKYMALPCGPVGERTAVFSFVLLKQSIFGLSTWC